MDPAAHQAASVVKRTADVSGMCVETPPAIENRVAAMSSAVVEHSRVALAPQISLPLQLGATGESWNAL